MTIENVTGPLTDSLRVVKPATIQHAREMIPDILANKRLRHIKFVTADSATYSLYNGDPTIHLGDRDHNLIFRHGDKAIEGLVRGNYMADEVDVEDIEMASSTLRTMISDLKLGVERRELHYFQFFHERYDELNQAQRAFAERIYGQGGSFVESMEKLLKEGIRETRIYLLGKYYVDDFIMNYAKDNDLLCATGFKRMIAFARACTFVMHHDHAEFSAQVNGRFIDPYHLDGDTILYGEVDYSRIALRAERRTDNEIDYAGMRGKIDYTKLAKTLAAPGLNPAELSRVLNPHSEHILRQTLEAYTTLKP